MCRSELFDTFNDVVGNTFSYGVDVARCKFLSECRTSTWVDDENHIAVGGIDMMGIATFKASACRVAPAVVVDNHRIFARRVEVGWEDVATTDAIAA